MEYVLKRILPSGVEAALQKADRYRALNQPMEAESICRDVLEVDADNQLALRILGLALTDQYVASRGALFTEACRVFTRLGDAYDRAFYAGLACERWAKAQLGAQIPLYAVRPLFDQALAHYADAEALRPPGNDDPILRWNSCVRALHAVPGFATAEREVRDDWETDFIPHQR
jgi:tetratricopeptide (TPR) repeat protein